ncbi:carbohydrate esterase family 9 protein [Xylona heveae TC161]|uniref:N-acetylglucosamine-6-phosphate deacetylase n=1 Tax=Xylona heveae (strain CBS 132557 / TC161) TaxID=1328760 RepID=A0A164ZV79_XYLHT|nr:carbohydrate esterase family 9 protein [Xylona heveae TC161]KZF19573.1 carbohydrate esterase family 9 protein [Xylona heveae TC161]
MPSLVTETGSKSLDGGIIKFTNCRLVKDDRLVEEDLWVSSLTGRILHQQEAFYEYGVSPDQVVDLQGKIISPGFIDVQLNGAFGVDFSVVPENIADYAKGLAYLNKNLIRTGVTAYLPTLTSQRREVYHQALPYLGPTGGRRAAQEGSESLGAHCEGPFLSPTKRGIHSIDVLRSGDNGFQDFVECYGEKNLGVSPHSHGPKATVKMITAAPEMGGIMNAIPEVASRDIVFSIGHSESTYEEASEAAKAGATMVTHLFNAMRPLHHRNPGIFGLLGTSQQTPSPYFGVIADGIHLHPTSVKIAYSSHPDGFILVTDAMSLVGLPDGVYEWTNGERIEKKGPLLTLEGSDKIAGSSTTLLECVTNFLNWTGASIPQALKAITATPAKMLGLERSKGTLRGGADADLVILDESRDDSGHATLSIDQVWKFGHCVYSQN